MKERPLLFSGLMVRAILAGQKTQTRRMVKPQPDGVTRSGEPYIFQSIERVNPDTLKVETLTHHPESGNPFVKPLVCPYGAVGDHLWVKETWAPFRRDNGWLHYVEGRPRDLPLDCEFLYHATTGLASVAKPGPWKPSLHMIRRASRITLEITGIRVERLQEISEADAVAEGVPVPDSAGYFSFPRSTPRGAAKTFLSARGAFEHLWDSINGKRGFGWDVNPWVWVVEFKRVNGEAP